MNTESEMREMLNIINSGNIKLLEEKITYNNVGLHPICYIGINSNRPEKISYTIKVIDLFIESGADINDIFTRGSKREYSAIVCACEYGCSPEILTFVLKHGANPNLFVNGAPAIARAIEEANYNAVKLLLEYGANVDFIDEEGNNLLHKTLEEYEFYNTHYSEEYIKISALLIERNVNYEHKNKNGDSPIDIIMCKITKPCGYYEECDRTYIEILHQMLYKTRKNSIYDYSICDGYECECNYEYKCEECECD